ncbi:hypothetical protein KAU45_10670 [bacterium]|nr:hypothetical protein [bacterium]
MKALPLLLIAVAAYATGVEPSDPFLEGIEFGADADVVVEVMKGAGYGLQESSDDLIIGVRGNERLEYRFTAAGEPSFAEYSLEADSATVEDELDTWRERLSNTWGTPSAVSVDGYQLWIIPHAYSIRLYTEDAGLIVSISWD